MQTDNEPRRSPIAGLLFLPILLAVPSQGVSQYVVTSPAGDSLVFEAAELRVMLDTARALYHDLEVDPHVYYITPGPNRAPRQSVPVEAPEAAYPWNAITVLDDSTADVLRLPANLREADRAYYNYAVMRMRVVRGADPDVPCDSILALEEAVVGSFIDGWLLSRTLFGGPAFAPLDELAFARSAGHLRALLAAKNDRQAGACAAQWAEANLDRVTEYDAWRKERFPLPGEDAEPEDAEPDEVPEPGASEPLDTAGAVEPPDGL